LTPGQFDAVFGTYGPAFVNAHVLAVTVVVGERVDRRRVVRAVVELRRRHPALRARLSEFGDAEDCRQVVDAADGDGAAIREIAEESDADRVAELLTGGLAELARGFDVVEGRTWGVVCARIASVSYLVFAFTHFVSDLLSVMMVVREFAQLYNGDAGAVAGFGDDGYARYLDELAAARRSSSRGPEVAWWLNRPWTDLSVMPGVGRGLVAERDWAERIESIPRGSRLTDLDVIAAVGRSLRDVGGLSRTRIDVATHGRLTRSRWSAIGCIARVVPYFVDWEGNPSAVGVTRLLCEVKAREPVWDAAHSAVRRLPTVPVDKQLGAHAFVNFHGSLDAARFVVPPFSLSPVRPSFRWPPRFPFTPFRLTVRPAGDRWMLSWRHNAFTDDEFPAEVVARTTALLGHR
jgi:hypothetical protein